MPELDYLYGTKKVSTGTPNFGPPSANTSNQTSYQDPREQGIMAAATANMPLPPTPPITQTQTGGDFGGYETQQQQYAASVLDYQDDAGIVGGGVGLGSSGYLQETDEPGVYYTTYPEGTSAYSPTGLITMSGGNALYENGELIEGEPLQHHIYNPYSFDQNFYGMDDFDYNYYGGQGPTEASETFAGAPWSQKGLGEILAEGPKGFGEMESIYGEEFDPERDASFLYLTGIPQFKDQTIYDYV